MSSNSKLFFVLGLFLLSIVGGYTLWYNSLIEIKPTSFVDNSSGSSTSLRSDVKINSNIGYITDSDFSMETEVVDLDTKDKDYVEGKFEYKTLKKFSFGKNNFTLTEWEDQPLIDKFSTSDGFEGKKNTELLVGVLGNKYYKSDFDNFKSVTKENNKFLRDFESAKKGLVDMISSLDDKFSKNDVISSTGSSFDNHTKFETENNFSYEILHVPFYIFYLSNEDFEKSFVKFHNIGSKMMRSSTAINTVFGMQIIKNLNIVLEKKILVGDIDKQSVQRIMSSINKSDDWKNSFKLFLANNLKIYNNYQFKVYLKEFNASKFYEIPYNELIIQWKNFKKGGDNIGTTDLEISEDKSIIDDINYFNDAYAFKNLSEDLQILRNHMIRIDNNAPDYLIYYKMYEATVTDFDKFINLK